MDKPCKHCNKSIHKGVGGFEQECNGTCEQFNTYADGISKGLDEILVQGRTILKKYGAEF